jgi:hypothetical protein
VQTVQIDCSQHVGYRGFDKVKSRVELDLAARGSWIKVNLSRDCKEVLSKHLKGNHAAAFAPMLQDEIDCFFLLDGIGGILRVHEDIGVQKRPRKPGLKLATCDGGRAAACAA